jgi:hypothetical protein
MRTIRARHAVTVDDREEAVPVGGAGVSAAPEAD